MRGIFSKRGGRKAVVSEGFSPAERAARRRPHDTKIPIETTTFFCAPTRFGARREKQTKVGKSISAKLIFSSKKEEKNPVSKREGEKASGPSQLFWVYLFLVFYSFLYQLINDVFRRKRYRV